MLDSEKIKQTLRHRGLTLGMWCSGRDIEYAALHRVLRGTASKEVAQRIRSALALDGLLFEARGQEPTRANCPAPGDWSRAVFWSFPEAAAYLGIKEGRIRRWSAEGLCGFPRALRLGKGSALMLQREAVQDWVANVLTKQGVRTEKEVADD